MAIDSCHRLADISQDRVCRVAFAQIRKAAYDYCMDADDDPFCLSFPEKMPSLPQTADELPAYFLEMLPRREYLGDIRLGLGYTTIDSAKALYNSVMFGRPLPPRPTMPQDVYQEPGFFRKIINRLKPLLKLIGEKVYYLS